jgi:hypothetical protein
MDLPSIEALKETANRSRYPSHARRAEVVRRIQTEDKDNQHHHCDSPWEPPIPRRICHRCHIKHNQHNRQEFGTDFSQDFFARERPPFIAKIVQIKCFSSFNVYPAEAGNLAKNWFSDLFRTATGAVSQPNPSRIPLASSPAADPSGCSLGCWDAINIQGDLSERVLSQRSSTAMLMR